MKRHEKICERTRERQPLAENVVQTLCRIRPLLLLVIRSRLAAHSHHRHSPRWRRPARCSLCGYFSATTYFLPLLWLWHCCCCPDCSVIHLLKLNYKNVAEMIDIQRHALMSTCSPRASLHMSSACTAQWHSAASRLLCAQRLMAVSDAVSVNLEQKSCWRKNLCSNNRNMNRMLANGISKNVFANIFNQWIMLIMIRSHGNEEKNVHPYIIHA